MASEDPVFEVPGSSTFIESGTGETGGGGEHERHSSDPSGGAGRRRPPPPPPKGLGIGSSSPVPLPVAPPPVSSSSSSSSSTSQGSTPVLDKKQKEEVETLKYYLKQALQIKDEKACKDLLTRAAKIGMSGDLVTQAQTLILDKASEQRVEEIETLRVYLKQGIELKNREILLVALSKVDKLSQTGSGSGGRRLNTEFFDLVSKARKELLRLNQQEASTIQVYLKQGIEMKNREMLVTALERAETINRTNPELLDQELHKKATQLRSELDLKHLITRILQQAVEAKDAQALTSALSKADALKMGKDIEEVAKADKLLGELKKRESKRRQKEVKKTKRPTSKGGFVLFGGELKTAVERSQGKDVPRICYETIEYLKKSALTEPGLFRVSGNADNIQIIKEQYSSEEAVKLIDVHDAAGVLKQYLRKLPEPLIPFANYPDFIRVGTLSPKDITRNGKLRELMTKLPKDNLALLTYLMRFLKEVSKNAEVNKMTPDNIAIVFAPNLLRPKVETTTSMMVEMPISIGLIASFITHFDEIFGDSPSSGSSSSSTSSPLGAGSPSHSAPPSPLPSPIHSPATTRHLDSS